MFTRLCALAYRTAAGVVEEVMPPACTTGSPPFCTQAHIDV
jgi:hypothetical protein